MIKTQAARWVNKLASCGAICRQTCGAFATFLRTRLCSRDLFNRIFRSGASVSCIIRPISSLEERTKVPSATGTEVTQMRTDTNRCNRNKITWKRLETTLYTAITDGLGWRKELAQSEGVVTDATRLEGVDDRDHSRSSMPTRQFLPSYRSVCFVRLTHLRPLYRVASSLLAAVGAHHSLLRSGVDRALCSFAPDFVRGGLRRHCPRGDALTQVPHHLFRTE